MKNFAVTKSRRKHKDKYSKRVVIVRIKATEPKFELDFDVLKRNGQPLKLTDAQYKSPAQEVQNLIDTNKDVIREATLYIYENGGAINRKKIEKRIRELQHLNFLEVVSSFQKSKVELSENETQNILDSIDDEVDQLEDIVDIVAWEESELINKKNHEEILASYKVRNTLERTKRQYTLLDWDHKNIILAIGYLFTFDQDNDDPLIPSIYRGVLNNLYEYQHKRKVSNSISNYNSEYCREFIKYIIRSGVIKTSLGKTPHEIISGKYNNFFKEKEADYISYSTLKDKIKAVNAFNSNLYRLGYLERRIEKFKPESFVKRTVITEKGTKVDHHLSVVEVHQLLEEKLEDNQLDLVRDTFIILMFCGGLRGVDGFDVIIDQDKINLDVFHPKVEKRCTVPIFDELRPTLEKHQYSFPKFEFEDNIANMLRKLATHMNWTRDIKTVNTFVNRKKGDDYYFFDPLNEIIDLTFARKSFVNFARREHNMSDGVIIQFTGHASVDILQHYMGELTSDELRDKMKKRN